MNNRVVISDNEEVILQESHNGYFCYVDREVDYAYTFSNEKIDVIIEFLSEIKNRG